MGLVYVKTSSGKKRLNAKQQRALAEHKAYIQSLLPKSSGPRALPEDKPQGAVRQPDLPPLSNSLCGGGGFKRTIDDYKWRKGSAEPAHVIKEIEAKKKRLAPAYSKGGYQYISPEADLTTLGRKV